MQSQAAALPCRKRKVGPYG